MEKNRSKKQIDNKLIKVQEKLKEYKKKLKAMPIILFTVLYSFIFTLMFPIGGVVGLIKALIGGIGAIATSIYFWRYREVVEPKYENYVKFLEDETKSLLEDLKALELEQKTEVSNQPRQDEQKTNKTISKLTENKNLDDSNINSL